MNSLKTLKKLTILGQKNLPEIDAKKLALREEIYSDGMLKAAKDGLFEYTITLITEEEVTKLKPFFKRLSDEGYTVTIHTPGPIYNKVTISWE